MHDGTGSRDDRKGPGELAEAVRATRDAIASHPSVTSVELVGSRGRGDDVPLSDWDLAVKTSDFASFAADLPGLVEVAGPLAKQWDRLSDHGCYMLMFRGPMKVDLIFDDVPREPDGPWEARPDTLEGIDRHFWDWVLWLAGKAQRGKEDLVATELRTMYDHLLAPMEARSRPADLEQALSAYRRAREGLERRFGREVPRTLDEEVSGMLRREGYRV